jgi:hypothetical protein
VVRAAAIGTPMRSTLRLGEWEMWGGMSAVRRRELLTLLYGRRGAGRSDGEGDREAGGGDINAGRPVRWGGEMKG